MKKRTKIIALSAIVLFASAGITAYAYNSRTSKKFAPSAIGYYLNASSNCIAITAGMGNTPFDSQGAYVAAAIIDKNGNQVPIYSDQNCTQRARFNNP